MWSHEDQESQAPQRQSLEIKSPDITSTSCALPRICFFHPLVQSGKMNESIQFEKMWSGSFCSSSCFIRLHTRCWVAQWIFQPQLSSNTVKAQLPKKKPKAKVDSARWTLSDLGPLRWSLLHDQSMGCHTRCSCPHVCTEKMWWNVHTEHPDRS